MAFIDDMRAEGHADESTCRVLREQGCQVAARTYRAWRRGRPPYALRRRDRGCHPGHDRHPGRALRSPQNDSPSAAGRPQRGVLHRGPPHGRSGPERHPARQKCAHHRAAQGRRPRGGPAEPPVPSRGTQPGAGGRLLPYAHVGPGFATSPSSSTSSPRRSWPGMPPPTNAPTWCSPRCGSRYGTATATATPSKPGN